MSPIVAADIVDSVRDNRIYTDVHGEFNDQLNAIHHAFVSVEIAQMNGE